MHSGLVTVNGHKMAKSAGNVIGLSQVLDRQPNPDVLKLLFAMTHYRSPLDFTWEKLDDAAKACQRFITLADTVDQLTTQRHRQQGAESRQPVPPALTPAMTAVQAQFDQALADDVNTPEAIAALFELVRLGHSAFEAGALEAATAIVADIQQRGVLLGLFAQRGSRRLTVDPKVQELMDKRTAARQAKDFATADRLRREIQQHGYVVEDTAGGTICRPT